MANRLTTWADAQILTDTALNAEINNVYVGDISRSAGYWGHNDDIPEAFGTSQDAYLEWNTDQATDCLVVGLGTGNIFSIMEKGDMGTDWGIASQTNPTLFVHSADATATTDYVQIYHNQTNAVVNAGAGSLLLQRAGTTGLTVGASGAVTANVSLTVGEAAGVAVMTDILWGQATLDFGNVADGASESKNITCTGAVAGDVVALGVPTGSVPAAGAGFYAYCSTDVVVVRFFNGSGGALDPPSGTFNALVFKLT